MYGITFSELYPILVALYLFGTVLRNCKVAFHSDNAAVYIINKQSSCSPRLKKLVRQLVLQALHLNVKFKNFEDRPAADGMVLGQ